MATEEIETCSCKSEMVQLNGSLKNGGIVWACPSCDVPDKLTSKGKSIIELSWENNE